ncbi:chromatin assembly factor 1 subunit FAS1-like, partial [Trifolium medium]|nr:chromatin assembly factor 1 subunit FAS1-like [Trifolium medium]
MQIDNTVVTDFETTPPPPPPQDPTPNRPKTNPRKRKKDANLPLQNLRSPEEKQA